MSGPDDWNLSPNQHFQNMKHKPHKLTRRAAPGTAAIFAAAVLALGSYVPAAGQDEAAEASSQTTAEPAAAAKVTDLDAVQLLEETRNNLESLDSLQCSLHERVDLSDLTFYATGNYSQASGNRMRLEFRMYPIRGLKQTDKAALAIDAAPQDTGKQKPTGSLQQVSNGSNLWTFWQNGDSRRLTRRNIRDVVQAAEESETFDSPAMLKDLGVGGLQTLLARLELGMEFGKVREEMVGDTRLLVLAGRWTAESLKEFFQLQDPTAPLPLWAPDYVRVYLDADRKLPRRIQYLKKHINPNANQVRPLITVDFRELTVNGELADGLFEFQPPDGVPELDLTEQTVEAIRNAAGTTPAAGPAEEPDKSEG